MPNKKKIDCVILGLLSHEELTGYEIKKRIDTTIKYFWSASYASIYPTLSDLVDRRFVTKKESNENKRNKFVYTITDKGRRYLHEWLKLPAENHEFHCETLIKIFFGNEQEPTQVLLHIKTFERKIKKELQYLLEAKQNLKSCLDDDYAHKYYLFTLEFGIKNYRTYLEWCEKSEKLLKEMGNKQ